MCRNVKTLFNFAPPATEEEIRAASLQFVRKVSGFNTPSKANEAAFLAAVDAIAAASGTLLSSLVTNAPPRNRSEEAAKARARGSRGLPSDRSLSAAARRTDGDAGRDVSRPYNDESGHSCPPVP